MAIKRYKPEQIVTLLRRSKWESATAKPQACNQAGITAQTYYRWQKVREYS
jgi:hypothetical protein